MYALNSAAQLRSLKPSISGNAFPVLAYLVGDISSESINTLPKVTQDGSHLVAPSSIVKNWLLLQASKQTTISQLFDDTICMELLRRPDSIVTYKHLSPYSANERVFPDNLLPVHPSLGMLSSQAKTSDLGFNSLFFTMESSDMQNFHTLFGQPYGLTVNNGYVSTLAPFNRGTLLICKSGKVMVQTLALIAFMNKWNDLLWAILYRSNSTLMTVSMAVTQFQSEYSARWNLLLTGSLLPVWPLFIVFVQKYVVQGITHTGLKG